MKLAIFTLLLVMQIFAFDKQDTIWTGTNSYIVKNYINSNFNNMMIHVSNDQYTDGILTKNTVLWGDSINTMIVDSITTEYHEGYHYVFTWRADIVHTQIAYYDEIIEIDVSDDSRNTVKKSDSNIVKFNSYEVRVFCNRIVELYFLNGVKVYSTYTSAYCKEEHEVKEPTDTTPKYLNPIG